MKPITVNFTKKEIITGLLINRRTNPKSIMLPVRTPRNAKKYNPRYKNTKCQETKRL
jgi:hypothetical protein